jgi:hypothetical protein
MGLMLFVLKVGSRRQLRFELDSPEALANHNRLAACAQETMAHSDTLDHFLGHVPPDQYPKLRRQMIYRLIRMKVLDSARLFGHFLVVLDGTGQLFFRQRHCPHCLEQTVNGQTHYYHQVLEAKIVTPDGLALSVGSEFIENTDPKATKQDCELQAFSRLAVRLKRDFPQLPLCLCLDGLYAKGTVLQTCHDHHWKYLITFQSGSLPAVWNEYLCLRDLCPQNHRTCVPSVGIRQELRWVEDLAFTDDQKRRHRFGAFQCHEEGGRQQRLFAWITNFHLRAENVAILANRGGRCRWKIENEGFNIQKNGGFNLEHAYSTGSWQIANFYVLLQIAHLILQLVERGSLLNGNCKRLFGSIRNLARRLAESLRNHPISAEALEPAAIQIRLNSS